MAKYKKHTQEFKAKVALEATKGIKTASEIASTYQVHPSQILAWKKQMLKGLPALFGQKKNNKEEENTGRLYEEIGRLKVELDWLKKKSERLH